MIFITVGTSNFSFNRLLRIIDELCIDGVICPSEVFAQIGDTEYIPQNYKYVKFTTSEEHKKKIASAKIIITHAGTGSIVSSLKMDKKVIAFPRLSKYEEHIDDHQLELVEAFVRPGYILHAINKEQLINAIKEAQMFTPTKFISNTENFEELLDNLIRNL